MPQNIYPCLWFNGQAKEATVFYCNVFQDCRILDENNLVITFAAANEKFMCLNGGPDYKINPAVSFFVFVNNEEEIDYTWNKLVKGGQVLMELNKYPWSEKYGWVQDQYGVSWQLFLKPEQKQAQQIVPAFMFTGAVSSKAEEAIKYYVDLFPESEVDQLNKYEAGENDKEDNIKHGTFTLNRHPFIAFDSSYDHGFSFNEGVSFVVSCKDQREIDLYWDKLSSDGEPGQCGWLKDKYGISWQIVPSALHELMRDPEKRKRVIDALMKMKKMDIAALENA